MLEGNVKIYQIKGKVFKSNGSIEYTLHAPIRYLTRSDDRIYLVNKPPFGNYQAGDFLGVDIEKTYWQSATANHKIWDDKSVVSKVIARPPQFYNKQVFSSEEFGDGWVEESE